jgi:ABC-type transport system involved in multi-copper enzyme maturation permease subunit
VPIYDLTYRGHKGARSRSPVWFPVVDNTIRLALRNKILFRIYFLAAIPPLIAGVVVYFRYQIQMQGARIPEQLMFGLKRYFEWLRFQGAVALVLAGIVGAAAIAADRRGNALEAIFSRPITRTHYLFGRFVGLFALTLASTLIPGLLIWYFDVTFSLEPDRFVAVLGYPMRIASWAVVHAASATLLILAFSALSARWVIAAAAYGAFLFVNSAFLEPIAAAVERGSTSAAEVIRGFAYLEASWAVQAAIFGVTRAESRLEISTVASVVYLVAIALLCVVVLRRRVRPIEVVS